MLSLADRLAVLTDAPAGAACAAMAGDLRALDAGQSARFRALPTDAAALARVRVDVNAAPARQIARFPRVSAEAAARLVARRPVATIAEAAAILGAAPDDLAQVFEVRKVALPGRTSGVVRWLEPVPGSLVGLAAELRGGFDAGRGAAGADVRVRSLGPLLVSRSAPGSAPGGFEGAGALEPGAFGGWVLPLYRDDLGAERCLTPGGFEVWAQPGANSDAIAAALEALGLRVVQRFADTGLMRARLARVDPDRPIAATLEQTLAAVDAIPGVAFAEPEEVSLTPDFEDGGGGLGQALVPGGWAHGLIGLDAAHARTTGDPAVTVAVIDAGADLGHPDLAHALRPDWAGRALNYAQCFDGLSGDSPHDAVQTHGTAVASLVVGPGGLDPQGAPRVRGVAPGVRFVPVRIAQCTPYGLRAQAILRAIELFAPPARGIITISWATASDHEGVWRALKAATDAGHAVTTSAGNYPLGTPRADQQAGAPHFPSDYAMTDRPPPDDRLAGRRLGGLCAVAAVNHLGAKAGYSFFGPSVTFAAPGGEAPTLDLGVHVAAPHGQRRSACGTSFAAPMAAGALALLVSARPGLSPHGAVAALKSTARGLAATEPVDHAELGAGLIDVAAALAAVAGAPATAAPGAAPAEPAPEEPAPAEPAPAGAAAGAGLDLNTAQAAEIAALPLLGPWSAGRIVANRASVGPFLRLADLTSRGLLDAWTLARLEGLVRL